MNNAMANIEDAVKLHHEGELFHAVEKYRAFLDEHPDYTPVMHLLGVAYHQQQEYKLAEEMLSNIHEREPDNTDFMVDLARVYDSQDEYSKSIKLLEQAIEIAPDNPEYHYRLAGICEQNHEIDSAIQHYLDVLDLNVSNSTIYQSLGRLFEKNNNHEAAELAYTNAQLLNDSENNNTEEQLALEKNVVDIAQDYNPLVTIVIPTRSRMKYLQRALESVKMQNYEHWEAIVVNDAGDNFDEIVNHFSDDKRIKFLNHSFQMGPGAARNTALRIAQGEIIFYLDDDDIYLQNHIRHLVNLINSEGLDFACSNADVVLEDSDSGEELKRISPFDDIDVTLDSMHVTNSITICSCAHKLECLKEVGYFDEHITSYEDWDFILRILKKYKWKRSEYKSLEIKRRNSAVNCVTDDNQTDHIHNYHIIYERNPIDSESIQQARKETVEYLQRTLFEMNTSVENEDVSKDPLIQEDIYKNDILDYLEKGDIPSINEYTSIVKSAKDSLLSLSYPVKILIENVDVVLALQKYMDFLQHQPDYKAGHFQLGLLLNHLQQYQAAELAFDSAIALAPDYSDAIYAKAEAIYRQKRPDEALDLLLNMRIHDSIDAYTVHKIIQLHTQLASNDDAIAYAVSILESTGVRHAGIFNHLGNIYYQANDMPSAEKYYSEAVSIMPDYNDANVNLKLVKILTSNANLPLFLALPTGQGFGWGVCASYLRQELGKITDIFNLEYEDWTDNGNKYIPGTVFSSIGAEDLNTIYPVRGEKNIGYTFFERDLTDNAKVNARQYDLVLAGSTWAVERLKEAGIENVDLLIQGIDQKIFYPIENTNVNDGYFIFSGGKFEIRKGQDLVLKAIQVLQQKYPDIILVNAWVNFWPNSMATMSLSPYIEYDTGGHDEWQSLMQHIYEINHLNTDKIVTCDITSIDQLRELYGRTDLGVFPNRSEGGTNLVLMEYMACAKPVIASNTTGHSDIINHNNALVLDNYTEKNYYTEGNQLFATWQEPELEELIQKIEYAYLHRDQMNELGRHGGEYMKNFSWQQTAKSLISTLHKWSLF